MLLRRTKRSKVVWRCATRIEKGKELCSESPTINEEWIKEKLANTVVSGVYDENIIRERIEQICVYQSYLAVKGKNDEELLLHF